MALRNAITSNSLATSGLTANNLPVVYSAGAATSTRSAQKKKTLLPHHCHLAEGEKAHPAKNRGCRHAKEELQKRKLQRTPKTKTGRVFSSNLTTQASPSRRRSEVAQHNSSGLRNAKFQWQIYLQQENRMSFS
jgi:hypothetical protein